MQDFYLNTIITQLLQGDTNLTDYLPSGISFTYPQFFDDAGFNVSATTQVRAARARAREQPSMCPAEDRMH